MKIVIAIMYIFFAGIMWVLCAASSLTREKWEDNKQEAWIQEWLKKH